jgi:hypothetical protein
MNAKPILLVLAAAAAACRPAAEAPPVAKADAPAAVPPAPKLVFPVAFDHPELAAVPEGERKRILFLTDDGEHGWMQHENTAGAILLGKRLAAALPGCAVTVLRDQFPDPEMLAGAASIVLFTNGTEHHLLNDPEKRAAMEQAMQQGMGLAALHWALEAGTPEGSEFLKNHLGGFFEVD